MTLFALFLMVSLGFGGPAALYHWLLRGLDGDNRFNTWPRALALAALMAFSSAVMALFGVPPMARGMGALAMGMLASMKIYRIGPGMALGLGLLVAVGMQLLGLLLKGLGALEPVLAVAVVVLTTLVALIESHHHRTTNRQMEALAAGLPEPPENV
jgi:hypothetical protein